MANKYYSKTGAKRRPSRRTATANRKAAKRPANTLARARSGANKGLAKPRRSGSLRRY